MYRNNAIYFPYIVVPKSDWFVKVLLYWDDIFSIVPSDYLYNPDKLGSFMQTLVQEEFVKFAMPSALIPNINNFTEGYAQILTNNGLPKLSDLNKVRTFPIHIEKMEEVRIILDERGLCRESLVRGGYPWFDVETKAASLFMGYLAMKIGSLESIGADPLTDQEHNLQYFLSVSEKTPRKERTPSIREQVLDDILPAPGDSNLKDEDSLRDFIAKLRGFKNFNRDHLLKFRRKLEDEVFQIAKEEDQADRQELLERAIQRLKEDRDYIVEKILSCGWKVKLGKFLSLISFVDPTGLASKAKSAMELGGLIESNKSNGKAYAVYAAKYHVEFLKNEGDKRIF